MVMELDMEKGNFINICTNILGEMVSVERLSSSD